MKRGLPGCSLNGLVNVMERLCYTKKERMKEGKKVNRKEGWKEERKDIPQ